MAPDNGTVDDDKNAPAKGVTRHQFGSVAARARIQTSCATSESSNAGYI